MRARITSAVGRLRDNRQLVIGLGAPAVIALGLGIYTLTLPHVLYGIHSYTGYGYDDGVYLGAADRLVHGIFAYRDFALLHPPGIVWLMSPIALVGRFIGEPDALVIARCLTIGVTAANAALVALIMRSRGLVAMLVAGLGLALFPYAISANQTLLLEPYLVLFCLIGTLLAFKDGEVAPPRRVLLAGMAFGFAGLIKVWAIFPVLALLVVLWPKRRTVMKPALLGLVVGFGVPALPFFLLAPSDFVRDVVTAQIGRQSTGRLPMSTADRLLEMTALHGLPDLDAKGTHGVVAVVGFGLFVAAVYWITRRSRSRFDWFALGALVVTVAGMFQPPEFYDHYAYFIAPFVVLVLAVCVVALQALFAPAPSSRHAKPRQTSQFLIAGWFIAAAVLVTAVIPQETQFARTYLAAAEEPDAQIAAHIPSGACVVFDVPTLPMIADRFAAKGSCPGLVDPFGMWFLENDEKPPPAPAPFPAAFTAKWRSWLEQADNVVLSVAFSNFIPWDDDLTTWFKANYRLVYSQTHVWVYEHIRSDADADAALLDDPLVQQGLAALAAGKVDEARSFYQQAIASNPGNKIAYYNLGVTYQGTDPVKANAAYGQALKIDPKYKPALFNLAINLSDSQPEAAVALYRKLLEIDPSDANVHFNLGLLLGRNGPTPESEQELATAVKLNPDLQSRIPPSTTTTTTTPTTVKPKTTAKPATTTTTTR